MSVNTGMTLEEQFALDNNSLYLQATALYPNAGTIWQLNGLTGPRYGYMTGIVMTISGTGNVLVGGFASGSNLTLQYGDLTLLKGATFFYSGGTADLELIFTSTSGDSTVNIPMEKLIDTYQAGTGIGITGHQVSIMLSPTAEPYINIDTNNYLSLNGVGSALSQYVPLTGMTGDITLTSFDKGIVMGGATSSSNNNFLMQIGTTGIYYDYASHDDKASQDYFSHFEMSNTGYSFNTDPNGILSEPGHAEVDLNNEGYDLRIMGASTSGILTIAPSGNNCSLNTSDFSYQCQCDMSLMDGFNKLVQSNTTGTSASNYTSVMENLSLGGYNFSCENNGKYKDGIFIRPHLFVFTKHDLTSNKSLDIEFETTSNTNSSKCFIVVQGFSGENNIAYLTMGDTNGDIVLIPGASGYIGLASQVLPETSPAIIGSTAKPFTEGHFGKVLTASGGYAVAGGTSTQMLMADGSTKNDIYTMAVSAGYSGTENDFNKDIASVKGLSGVLSNINTTLATHTTAIAALQAKVGI